MSTSTSTRSSRWLGRRYLFRLGRLRVPAFAALLYIGFVCGVILGGYETGVGYSRFAISAVILLIFALAGARLWFLIGHPKYVTDRTVGVRLTNAGAGAYGGLVLSFAVSWPLVRLMGLEFWRFWDGTGIIMLTGMAVTRIGCLMNGCCSGRETHGHIGLWLPDDRGEWKRRYPTQLFEAGWSAIILGVGLCLYAPSERPGLLFLGSVAAYGIGRFGLELLRADASISALPTRINVAFSAILPVVALTAFVVKLH